MTAQMRLYINVDHVATVRQARRTDEPDPLEAALLCEAAGADGITAHLREDRRHIQDHDLERLRPAVKVLNVELATSAEIVALTCRLRPYQATLVPEQREEITTEGGLDLLRSGGRLRDTIRRLDEAGIRVSLFVDPDPATPGRRQGPRRARRGAAHGPVCEHLAPERRGPRRASRCRAARSGTWGCSSTPATGSPT